MTEQGPEKFCFTGDHRPVNAQTKKDQFSISHSDARRTKLTAAKIFVFLDFIHSYWQLRLHSSSQKCLSIQTPFGVFCPNRVPHGATSVVPYFQSNMELLFDNCNILIWLDDMLGFGNCPDSLQNVLQKMLRNCSTKVPKQNLKRCEVVGKAAQFVAGQSTAKA